MQPIRVWAPRASRVEVDTSGERLPMDRERGEWFRLPRPPAPMADYSLRLDGGDPLPDPRSGWQPQGPSGPSRVFDHAAFAWTDRDWRGRTLEKEVIYELHIGTFTPARTFEGAIEKLDHLVGLGVTAVEVMPVAEFSGVRNWGYDGVDLYAPHHAYGGPLGCKRFVDACHARGLLVLMDVVYNHLGPVGNYLDRFGPYFSERYHTPWGRPFNLDGPGSDEVRAYLIDNALMWLRDYHCDGLRLDAVHAIIDTSALHFLEELEGRVAALASQLERRLLLIAESDRNDPRPVWPRERGGYGLDAVWNDDFHHALHALVTGERNGYYADFGSISDLAAALTRGFVYDGRYSHFRRRRHGRPADRVSGHSLVGFLQNHDQVGNRALGERSNALMDESRLRLGAALVLTAPFTPLLFMGEEWAASTPFPFFSDHQDPEVAKATTEGRLREFAAFGWKPEQVPDPQDPRTFESATLRWEERRREPHAAMLKWHHDLIQLRKQTPALTNGRLDHVKVHFDEAGRWLTMRRGDICVACNFGDSPAQVPLEDAGSAILQSSGALVGNGAIAPGSVAIFSRR